MLKFTSKTYKFKYETVKLEDIIYMELNLFLMLIQLFILEDLGLQFDKLQIYYLIIILFYWSLISCCWWCTSKLICIVLHSPQVWECELRTPNLLIRCRNWYAKRDFCENIRQFICGRDILWFKETKYDFLTHKILIIKLNVTL